MRNDVLAALIIGLFVGCLATVWMAVACVMVVTAL
jgi:hypothetical protein